MIVFLKPLIPISPKKKILAVFLCFFLIFFAIQYFHQGFFCPDSYYHIKRAYLLRTEGFLGSLPWMQFTTVREKSMDIALLFWILLAPFTFGNLILGAKIAAALFAGFFFALFYWLLVKWKIKRARLWLSALFLCAPSFLVLLSVTRPHILAVSLVFSTIYFAAERKYLYLFVLGVFYTLAYEVFFIFLIIALCFLASEWVLFRKINGRLILASAGGVFWGLLLHPDSWHYLFYHVAVVLFYIPYYRFSGKLSMGAGLYNTPDHALLSAMPLFLILIFSGYILVIERKRFRSLAKQEKITVLSLGLLVLFFLAITLVSNMFIYYLAPAAILFSALVYKYFFNYQYFSPLIQSIKKDLKFKLSIILLLGVWIFLLGKTLTQNILTQDRFFHYQGGASWLAQNTPKQSIVFQSNWDSFPALFFYNSRNYYILGLDPSFMYQYDKDLFWQWHNLTNCGMVTTNPKVCDVLLKSNDDFEKFQSLTATGDIYNLIKNDLQAQYIFVDKKYTYFLECLKKDRELFQEKYADDFVVIYQLK